MKERVEFVKDTLKITGDHQWIVPLVFLARLDATVNSDVIGPIKSQHAGNFIENRFGSSPAGDTNENKAANRA